LKEDAVYYSKLDENNIFDTFKKLCKCGTSVRKGKRNVCMNLFGSTIGVTKYPRFLLNGVPKVLPRPFEHSRPGAKGFNLMKESWFKSFVTDLANIAWNFVEYQARSCDIYKAVKTVLINSMKYVPECCRISGTFFTMMSVNGDMNTSSSDGIKRHFDKEDEFNVVLHLGKSQGGSTLYYAADNEKITAGKPIKIIDFKHGQIQIGLFREVLHGVSKWTGPRGSINFAVKTKIVEHFKNHGMKYYSCLIKNGYDNVKSTNI